MFVHQQLRPEPFPAEWAKITTSTCMQSHMYAEVYLPSKTFCAYGTLIRPFTCRTWSFLRFKWPGKRLFWRSKILARKPVLTARLPKPKISVAETPQLWFWHPKNPKTGQNFLKTGLLTYRWKKSFLCKYYKYNICFGSPSNYRYFEKRMTFKKIWKEQRG